MTATEKAILVRWMDTEFRDAVVNDRKRIEESLWMLKVGIEKNKDHYDVMRAAIASFVKGLILGETPVTVPTDNN